MIPLSIGLFALACLCVYMFRDIPRCEHCNILWGAARRGQNTQYADYESNFVVLCPKCHEENEAFWAERWADYRAMIWF